MVLAGPIRAPSRAPSRIEDCLSNLTLSRLNNESTSFSPLSYFESLNHSLTPNSVFDKDDEHGIDRNPESPVFLVVFDAFESVESEPEDFLERASFLVVWSLR